VTIITLYASETSSPFFFFLAAFQKFSVSDDAGAPRAKLFREFAKTTSSTRWVLERAARAALALLFART
jgi:hypothetical protein